MTNTRGPAVRRISRYAAFSSVLTGALVADGASAQVSNPPIPAPVIQRGQQQQSNVTQERRAQQLERQSGPIDTLTKPVRVTQCPALTGEPVTALEFVGASQSYHSEIQAILDKAAGKKLDCAALDEIRAEIYDLYDRAGFPLTQIHAERVDGPPVTLRLIIREAKIGDSGFCKNHMLRRGPNNAFPIRKGEQFTLKALDQGIENVQRLETFEQQVPYNDEAMKSKDIDCLHDQGSTVIIKPGHVNGEGIVTVQTIQKRPIFLTLGDDNLGSRSTGRTRINAQAAIEDVLGLYERFEVAGSHTSDFRNGADRARNVSGAFTVPDGYWRLSLSANYFDYRSTVAVANQSFVTSGDQGNYAFDIARVIGRDQNDVWTVDGTLAIKDSNNFVNGVKLTTGSRQLTLLSGSLSYYHTLPDSAFTSTLSMTQGIKQFGALDDPHLSRAQPHAQYTQVGLVLNYRRDVHFGPKDKGGHWVRQDFFRFQSLLSASLAPHALYGTEQVQIGGPFTVRGFDDTSLSGDIGGFVRNEVSYVVPCPRLGEYGQFSVFGAVDGGWIIRNYGDKSLQKALAGIAGGVRASSRNIRAEARIEKSIASPPTFKRDGAIFRFTIAVSI